MRENDDKKMRAKQAKKTQKKPQSKTDGGLHPITREEYEKYEEKEVTATCEAGR